MFDTMINNIAQHKHFDAEGRDNEEHATKKKFTNRRAKCSLEGSTRTVCFAGLKECLLPLM